MNALYFLIPISLLILAGAVGMFLWSVRKGQYEDFQGPANDIIFDDRDEQLLRHDQTAHPRQRDDTRE